MEENNLLEEELENNNTNDVSKFKKYLICIKKSWFLILLFFVIGSLLGLIIANFTYKDKYQEVNLVEFNYKYTTEINFNINDVISENNITRCTEITKSFETGKKISTYQYVTIKDISIKDNGTYYTIYCNMDSFNVSQDYTYSNVAAKGFLKHLTLLPLITDEQIEVYNNDSTLTQNQVFSNFDLDYFNSTLDNGNLTIIYSNPDAVSLNKTNKIVYFTIWISSSALTFIVLALIFIYVFIDKLNLSIKKEYDNEYIYRTPFHISFFKDSLKYFKDIKSLVLMATLLAIVMVCKFIPIPSGFSDLGLGFGYLFLALACMLFGPAPALVIGALSDLIGFVIKPDGAFFIGYTIQAMFACFAYSLCLHKSYVTFQRCLIARVLVNFIANVIIGSISRSIMFGLSFDATMTYILTISLPKNLVYLLPQSLLLFFVLKAMSYPLGHMDLIDSRISKNISFF